MRLRMFVAVCAVAWTATVHGQLTPLQEIARDEFYGSGTLYRADVNMPAGQYMIMYDYVGTDGAGVIIVRRRDEPRDFEVRPNRPGSKHVSVSRVYGRDIRPLYHYRDWRPR